MILFFSSFRFFPSFLFFLLHLNCPVCFLLYAMIKRKEPTPSKKSKDTEMFSRIATLGRR